MKVTVPDGPQSYAYFWDLVEAWKACLSEYRREGKKWILFSDHSSYHSHALITASFFVDVVPIPIHESTREAEWETLVSNFAGTELLRLERLPDLSPQNYHEEAHKDLHLPWIGLRTSGSSGFPKLVVHSGESLRASALAQDSHLKISRFHWLSPLSVAHMGGLAALSRAFFLKSEITISQRKNWQLETLSHLQRCENPGISIVPAMIPRLFSNIEAKNSQTFSKNNFVLVGGAPLLSPERKQGEDCGIQLHATYGTTETASQIATEQSPGAGLILLPNYQAYLSPSGELQLKSNTLALGTWENSAINPLKVNSNGFWNTGDSASLEARTLTVLGRADDQINSGGVKVFPAEVESILVKHPNIEDCKVLGMPSTEWGQSVSVAVVLRNPSAVNCLPSIQEYLRQKIDSRKLPKHWLLLASLPRLTSGKVDILNLKRILSATIAKNKV